MKTTREKKERKDWRRVFAVEAAAAADTMVAAAAPEEN